MRWNAIIAVALACCVVSSPAVAGVVKLWSASCPEVQAVALDDSGNVYVAAGRYSGPITTTKLSPDGAQIWTRSWESYSYNEANAIALDSQAHVYVGGLTADPPGSGRLSPDYVTLKYDRRGDFQWRGWHPPGDDGGVRGIEVDSDDTIFVTGGYFDRNMWGHTTIKYSAAGDTVWVCRHGDGAGDALTLDGNGNAFVAGQSEFADCRTAKLDSGGHVVWDAQAYDHARPRGIGRDSYGNLYVAGEVGSDDGFFTIKYDSDGDSLWATRYPSGAAEAIAIDAGNNIYVTGSIGAHVVRDYFTVRYDVDGSEIWSATYDGPAAGVDTVSAMAFGPDGNVYVTGYSWGDDGRDRSTIAYDASSGGELWTIRSSGGGSDIALDPLGDVVVVGNDLAEKYGFSSTVRVDVNGGGDYLTIQEGIDAASEGDTVLVAPGTYTGTGNRDLDFRGKGLLLTSSAGTEATIIDCEGGVGVYHRGFHFHSGEDTTSVVEGFTITNGHLNSDHGAGVYCDGASPLVRSCIIADCNAGFYYGGGICYRNATVRLRDCEFVGNVAGNGGAVLLENCPSTLIERCDFVSNVAGNFEVGGRGGAIGCEGLVGCPDAVISDCRFTENGAYVGGALCLGGEIARCTFESNSAHTGGAISGGGLSLSECTFVGNVGVIWYDLSTPFYGGLGGALYFGGDNSIESCTFVENYVEDGDPGYPGMGGTLFCYAGSSVTIENTIVAYTLHGETCYGESPSLSCCDVYGNAEGDYVGPLAGQEGVNGNFSANPLFCDLDGGDLTLHECSPCADAPGCGLIGAFGVGCPGGGRMWVVPGDAPTIAAAMDSAAACDTVYVSPGFHYEHDIVMKSGVTLMGSTSGPGSFIDALGLGRVLIGTDLDSTTVIRNVGLTSGTAPTSEAGGVIKLMNSSPRFVSCSFQNGIATRGGGAEIDGGAPVFEDCLFLGNTGSRGGGATRVWSDASATFTGCEFLSNQTTEIGSGPGGAISFSSTFGTLVLDDCLFSYNYATSYGGAILCGDGVSHLADCLLVDNRGHNYGGAVSATNDAEVHVIGSTIADNTSNFGAGICARHDAVVTVDNTIVAFNEGDEAAMCYENASVTATCCDVYGNQYGDYEECLAGQEGVDGNFSEDPLFCETFNPDDPYSLAEQSPCVDAPGCGQVGARGVGCPTTGVEAEELPREYALEGNYPNPFNPTTRIRYALPAPGVVSLRVFDASGRLVRVLLDRAPRDAGYHAAAWDGTDDAGRRLASGVYFYRLSLNDETWTKRMVLLK